MQYGLGFPAGPEVMAHLGRSLIEQGYVANTQDAIKAFYSIKRQAVINSVNEEWPEANPQFKAYYGPASACVFAHNDEEGNRVLHITFSTDGTRAGCVLGSLGFDVCMHHSVYRQLLLEFPEMVIRALTDDMPSFFRPEETTDEGWYGMYDMFYSLLIRYDELANPIGIKRQTSGDL